VPPSARAAIDVLERARALETEGQGELVAYLLVDARRQHDGAGLGQRVQARRDVDSVAEHVLVRDDDVAQVQADAEGLAPLGRQVGIALAHAALQLDRRAHRLDRAGELHQHAVADRLHDAAAKTLDDRPDQLGKMGPQVEQRLLLVGAHHAAVAIDVGEQDRRQPPIRGRIGHRPSVSLPRCVGRPGGRTGARHSRRTPSRP
jgi:hypothetical protein